MWLCGTAGTAPAVAKVLPALLGGREADKEGNPVSPGSALGRAAGSGALPGKAAALGRPI